MWTRNLIVTTPIATNAEKDIQKGVTTFNATLTDQPEASSAYHTKVTSISLPVQILGKPFMNPTVSTSVKPSRLTSSASYVQTVDKTPIVPTVHSFRIPALSVAMNRSNVTDATSYAQRPDIPPQANTSSTQMYPSTSSIAITFDKQSIAPSVRKSVMSKVMSSASSTSSSVGSTGSTGVKTTKQTADASIAQIAHKSVISTAPPAESSDKSAVLYTVSTSMKALKKASTDTTGNRLYCIKLFRFMSAVSTLDILIVIPVWAYINW